MDPKQQPYLKEITTKEEYLKYIYEFEKGEGWDPSTSDAELYLAQGEHKNVYVGFIGDVPFCTFILLTYPDQKIAAFGAYATSQEFRGKGLTFPLFNEKYQQAVKAGFKVQFTASDSMLKKYMSVMNVACYGRSYRLALAKGAYRGGIQEDKFVLGPAEVSAQKLIAYDLAVCGYDRSISVRKFLELKELITWVYEDAEGVIQGYVVAKKVVSGHRAGPLIADSQAIAAILIGKVLSLLSDGEQFSVDFPDVGTNSKHKDFLLSLGFQERGGFGIVGQAPYPHKWSAIYGGYSVEIGL